MGSMIFPLQPENTRMAKTLAPHHKPVQQITMTTYTVKDLKYQPLQLYKQIPNWKVRFSLSLLKGKNRKQNTQNWNR